MVQELVSAGKALKAETDETKKMKLRQNEQSAREAFKAFEEKVGLKALNDEYLPLRAKFLKIYHTSGRNRLSNQLAELRKKKKAIEQQLNIKAIEKELARLNQHIIKEKVSGK